MAFNGAGTFVRLYTWVTDRLNSVPITDTRMDGEMDGFATGLSTCITKDGQTATTAKIPFASGISNGDGTVGAPAVAFTNDLDCGMYRIGVNNYGFAANGAKVLDISTTGLAITGTLTPSGAILPSASDGAALGSATLMWSDLFLASGAVVNFNNGDVTITHSANLLTFGGASSGYSFDGNILLPSAGVINFNAGNATITHSAGILSFGATLDAAQQVKWTGVISPAQITSDQNDYNPTGLSTASTIRITTDAFRTITGLQGGAAGRLLIIENIGSFTFYLADESASSTAANRFTTPLAGGITLVTGSAASLFYDGTTSRWRVLACWPLIASQTEMEAATSNGHFTPPAALHYHPAACKCWGQTTGGGTPSLTTSYNTTSITDTAVGRLTVTIGNDFSSANYSANLNTVNTTATLKMLGAVTKAAGSIILECGTAAATLADPSTGWDWQFFGDL